MGSFHWSAHRFIDVEVGLKGLIVLTTLALGASEKISIGLVTSIIVFALSLRVKTPVSSINFVAIYWFTAFILIPPILVPDSVDKLRHHFILILLLIMSAYWLRQVMPEGRVVKSIALCITSPTTVRLRFRRVLQVTFAISIMVLVLRIAIAGPRSWFSGEFIAQAMERYAARDAFEAITRLAGLLFAWAFFALFVIHRRFDIHLGRITILAAFVGLPLIGMARQILVYNVLFLLFALRRPRLITVLVGLATILIAGLAIGYLRASHLGGREGWSTVLSLVYGEFDSSIVYSTLLLRGNELGFQYGIPIIVPVIFSVIPRFIFPEKPYNSAGVYMQHFEPSALGAGYAFATGCFSDALMNFGIPGVAILAVAIGWVYSTVDIRAKRGDMRIFQYLLLFNMYQLMRGPLATTISFMLIQWAIYEIFVAVIVGRTSRAAVECSPRL